MYEIAFRIGGSLPSAARARIEREGILPAHHLPIRKLEMMGRAEMEPFRAKWLAVDGDGGLLANHQYAEIVEDVILKGHGRVGELLSWCVMPNHVHALVQPHDDVDLSTIVKIWKGCSAREINRLRGSHGAIWQRDYFDRIVRSTEELIQSLQYILQNPDVAGLDDWKFRGAMGLGTKLIQSLSVLQPLERWCRSEPHA